MAIRDLILSHGDPEQSFNELRLQWQEMVGQVLTPDKVIMRPKTSDTPGKAGDMVFELTSNTQLKIKVRGSDGTVRSVSLTLA